MKIIFLFFKKIENFWAKIFNLKKMGMPGGAHFFITINDSESKNLSFVIQLIDSLENAGLIVKERKQLF